MNPVQTTEHDTRYDIVIQIRVIEMCLKSHFMGEGFNVLLKIFVISWQTEYLPLAYGFNRTSLQCLLEIPSDTLNLCCSRTLYMKLKISRHNLQIHMNMLLSVGVCALRQTNVYVFHQQIPVESYL